MDILKIMLLYAGVVFMMNLVVAGLPNSELAAYSKPYGNFTRGASSFNQDANSTISHPSSWTVAAESLPLLGSFIAAAQQGSQLIGQVASMFSLTSVVQALDFPIELYNIVKFIDFLFMLVFGLFVATIVFGRGIISW